MIWGYPYFRKPPHGWWWNPQVNGNGMLKVLLKCFLILDVFDMFLMHMWIPNPSRSPHSSAEKYMNRTCDACFWANSATWLTQWKINFKVLQDKHHMDKKAIWKINFKVLQMDKQLPGYFMMIDICKPTSSYFNVIDKWKINFKVVQDGSHMDNWMAIS